MCCQNSCELVLKDVCSFLTPADSWAYAIPYRGIMQEFLKLPEHTKEVIEGLVEPATDIRRNATGTTGLSLAGLRPCRLLHVPRPTSRG
jgi:hypothetical protein